MFLLLFASLLSQPDDTKLSFRTEEVDKSLKVGYAVLAVDVNGDGKQDIVVVDTQRVIWLENPTWKVRVITQGVTKPDNVCIAAHDVDGDGQIDFALGAEWKPFNTKSGGTLQWLKRSKTLEEPWKVIPISDDIPTIHRIRFADLDGTGKPQLLVTPLMGRNSSQAKNWADGKLDVLSYTIPNKPEQERWLPTTVDSSLHVIHNLHFAPSLWENQRTLLTSSYEGVTAFTKKGNGYEKRLLGEGNQANPNGNRGSSEITLGYNKAKRPFLGTIEPWHGNQVVLYEPHEDGAKLPWKRTLLDEELKWGHAVTTADLDGDGEPELIAGVRDNFSKNYPCGVRIYQRTGAEWQRSLLDAGGVAVEDLTVADLNGDGKPDIIAVGRATGNIRVYWNETKKRD